jgi:DNA transposition AAA+ family ATPase
MKEQFVITKSVKKFYQAYDHINHKFKGVERMALIIGEPGLGKTATAIHCCAQNGAVMIRTLELMTGAWLVRKIVSELGGASTHRTDKNFDKIAQLLRDWPRIIIFDEIDRFASRPEILETIRDIHDVCHCPMILIGEEAADRKLSLNRRLYRRFVDIVKFERLNREDVQSFLAEVSDIKYQEDAVNRITTESGGKISGIITMVHRAEAVARTNNTRSVGAKDFK